MVAVNYSGFATPAGKSPVGGCRYVRCELKHKADFSGYMMESLVFQVSLRFSHMSPITQAIPSEESGISGERIEFPGSSDLRRRTQEDRRPDRGPGGAGKAPEFDPGIESASLDVKNLLTEVALLKGQGVQLKIIPGVTTGRDTLSVCMDIVNDAGQFSCYAACTALDMVRLNTAESMELDPVLRPGNISAGIPPFSIDSKVLPGGNLTARIYSNLDADSPLLFEVKFSIDELPEVRKQIFNKVVSLFSEHARQNARRLADIAPRKDAVFNPTIKVLDGNKISGEDMAAFRRILGMGYECFMGAFPSGGEIDRRLSFTDGVYKLFSFRLGEIELSRSDMHPLAVNGDLTTLEFFRRGQKVTDCKTDRNSGDVIEINGSPVVAKYTDKYGNTIIRTLLIHVGRNLFSEGITVYPPNAYSERPEVGREVLRVDLEKFGMGKISGIIFRETRPRLEKIGDVGIYTNMDPAVLRGEVRGSLEKLVGGVQRAESFLGVKPGSRARNIYLVNSASPNAFFSMKDPTSVVVQDELLKENVLAPERVGFHEAVHLLDGQSGGRISQILKPQFDAVSKDRPDFFQYINESNFIAGAKSGGHSADSPTEFLASLLNTLIEPGVIEKLKAAPSEISKCYTDTLKALRDGLLDEASKPNPAISRDAPLFRAIDTVVKSLDEKDGIAMSR